MTTDWVLMPVLTAASWPLSWAVVAAAGVWWLWPREAGDEPHRGTHSPTGLPQVLPKPARASRKRLGPAWLTGLMAASVAWLALWPHGGWSGYAALALQSPSLLSLTWAIAYLLQATRWPQVASDTSRVPVAVWYLLFALGWLLTIDTLNLWPRSWDISLFSWGFSAGSLWLCAALVGMLAWLRQGVWVWHCVVVLALYAGLRWPTGNLWDAWLDPAVWIVAHGFILRHAWRWLRNRQVT